ncbi:hypothetical protein KR222_008390, partial [Zaprionus bogoriensis]
TSDLIMLVTFRMNRVSRNYRFVHKVLSAEKKTLQDISTMNRLGLVNTAAMFSFLNQSLYEKQLDSIQYTRKSSVDVLPRKASEDFTLLDHNDFVQMVISLWYAIIANTEVVSYLAVFINQAANSSVISLPMPFLVLYWGALTLPRPTKTFWVTLITYTLAMIFIKCIIHQKVVLDHKLIKLATTMDFELFVKHGKAAYDLFLLVVLFWHRYMLKKQGIWNIPRSSTDELMEEKMESGSEPQRTEENNDDNQNDYFEQDMDELLRPGNQNKYVYENIESEYYRTTIKRLENNGGILTSIKKLFFTLLYKARLSTDVYTLMFLCDFINFFVLLFGFPKFVYRHKYSASVVETYIQGNKIPFTFLFMLVEQFAIIIVERVIYLRKAMKVKIVIHFIMVLGIHIWMFFLVPYVTAHSFGASAPVIFYLIKCLQMLLSAYQMRCGYPRRILGNVFTKSFSMVNYVAFKVYMEIPFLYILRTMLDWLCIDTTLTVMEWIKMEDIFQSAFIVRCYRQMDSDFPVLRGLPKTLCSKCLIGGTILLLLFVLIWSPLFLFALVGTVGKANVPRRADIAFKIGRYEPIYVSHTYSGIHQFTMKDYRQLRKNFMHDIYAADHIRIYDPVDITAIKFDSNSVTLWNMPPPDRTRLIRDLNEGMPMELRIRLSFHCGNTMDTVNYEIIGLYTTCVYVVSRVIRSLIANNHRRIMFEDLPYVDRILKLCNDIYFVREAKEYRLEEDLYAKLIFLYRSPETLIKWTRYKEEFMDDRSSSEVNQGPTNAPPRSHDAESQTHS